MQKEKPVSRYGKELIEDLFEQILNSEWPEYYRPSFIQYLRKRFGDEELCLAVEGGSRYAFIDLQAEAFTYLNTVERVPFDNLSPDKMTGGYPECVRKLAKEAEEQIHAGGYYDNITGKFLGLLTVGGVSF